MSRLATVVCAGFSLVALAGCLSTSADANEPMPALVEMNSATKQTLERAASELLFGRQLSFSSSAFTTNSKVLIDKKQARDSQGQLLNGRELQAEVIAFTLWKQNQQCWLQRDDTEARVVLNGVSCKVR
ncbi:hypothetical protein [Neiella marina]|uniref:hypothetical protein n=1 Tax=Neiella marina TaxID=508461 RepID=UPI000B3CB549|nr:hypothetical protein [Neiella marina]